MLAGLFIIGLTACGEKPVETLSVQTNIQTLELTIGEIATVSATVVADGAELAKPSLEWFSSDSVVATVDGGLITAVKAGKTTVTAVCRYGGKETVASVKVAVKKPEIMLEPETPVLMDLSEQDGGLVAFQLPMDAENVNSVTLAGAEYRIVPQGDQVLMQANDLSPGEYIMTVEQEKQIVSFPVCIASMVIRSGEDLRKATKLSGADKGYFVLANSIDCAELEDPICFTSQAVFETNLGQNRAGFLGGFNGMGYTIFNLKVPENGLFGCLAGKAVVRDVGFVNLVSEGDNAICLYSAGLISQVYVQGDFSQVLQHSFGPVNKLENIVAETTRPDGTLSGNIASVDTTGYSVSDVHALIMVGENAKISGYSRTPQFNRVTMDTTLRAFAGSTKESIPAVTAEDNFNSYWDISSGYPVFITSVN